LQSQYIHRSAQNLKLSGCASYVRSFVPTCNEHKFSQSCKIVNLKRKDDDWLATRETNLNKTENSGVISVFERSKKFYWPIQLKKKTIRFSSSGSTLFLFTLIYFNNLHCIYLLSYKNFPISGRRMLTKNRSLSIIVYIFIYNWHHSLRFILLSLNYKSCNILDFNTGTYSLGHY